MSQDITSVTNTLTASQIEILQWAAKGHTPKEIAAATGRTLKTVNFHLQGAYDRLGANNRTHAVYLAHQLKLIKVWL